MKTKISTISRSLILVLVLITITSSRNPAKAAEPAAKTTLLTGVKNISRIEVSGNVEILLTQGAEEQVKVYDEYYSKNALVQWEDGVLRISSYQDKKLTVLVGVTHVQSISAAGNAVIRSVNRLSSIDLEVCLKDNAAAFLDAQALNLATSLTDFAKLELSGEAESQQIIMSEAAQLKAESFESENRALTISDSAVASIGNTEVRTSPMVSRLAKGF